MPGSADRCVPHRRARAAGLETPAIDFDVEIERLPSPKGDRVKISMSGKFLPYKYYGNEAGIPDYGLKE